MSEEVKNKLLERAERLGAEHAEFKELVNLIIENNNLNLVDKKCLTILFYNEVIYDYDLCELLLKNGANPNFQTTDGTTPIMHAIIKYQKNIVLLFVKYGANIYIKDKRFNSPISMVRKIWPLGGKRWFYGQLNIIRSKAIEEKNELESLEDEIRRTLKL